MLNMGRNKLRKLFCRGSKKEDPTGQEAIVSGVLTSGWIIPWITRDLQTSSPHDHGLGIFLGVAGGLIIFFALLESGISNILVSHWKFRRGIRNLDARTIGQIITGAEKEIEWLQKTYVESIENERDQAIARQADMAKAMKYYRLKFKSGDEEARLVAERYLENGQRDAECIDNAVSRLKALCIQAGEKVKVAKKELAELKELYAGAYAQTIMSEAGRAGRRLTHDVSVMEASMAKLGQRQQELLTALRELRRASLDEVVVASELGYDQATGVEYTGHKTDEDSVQAGRI